MTPLSPLQMLQVLGRELEALGIGYQIRSVQDEGFPSLHVLPDYGYNTITVIPGYRRNVYLFREGQYNFVSVPTTQPEKCAEYVRQIADLASGGI